MSGYIKGGILGCCALLVIQFIRPARTNPPVVEANTIEAKVNVPPNVERIFTSACKDCHSNETRWPWYSQVAPVSWFVIDHVDEGRRRTNFSEWPPSVQVPIQSAKRRRPTACERVESGDMPLFSYRLIHKDSRLTVEDKKAFCAWANGVPLP